MDFAVPKAKKKASDPTDGLPESHEAEASQPQASQAAEPPPAEGFPPVPYNPPQWAASPRFGFQFEVLKSGEIIETIDISTKDHLLVGRLPNCDLVLEHASISRYHAVIQHSSEGWAYIYDLSSTHGTKVNKARVPARRFVRLKVGSVIKFGESSRLFILLGPPQFESDAEGMATTGERAEEMMNQSEVDDSENNGISWGMRDDAPEENSEYQSFGATKELDTSEDAWFMKDPKKILRNWLEHHQYDNTFTYEEEKQDHEKVYVARLELPIDTGHGKYALGTGTKKKDAEKECAIDACRKLDAAGLLRGDASALEALKKQKMKALLGDDDSDEDSFYDRTGQAGKKKKDTAKGKKQPQQVETYESLLKKQQQMEAELEELQNQIAEAERHLEQQDKKEEEDLDDYMKGLTAPKITLESKYKLEKKFQDMKKELDKLGRLVNLAKPSLGSYEKFLPPESKTQVASVVKKPAAPTPPPTRPSQSKEEVPFKPEEEEENEGEEPPKPAPTSAPKSNEPRGPSAAPQISVPQKRKEAEPEESSEHNGEGEVTKPTPTPPPAEKKRKVYGVMTKERFDELTGGEEATAWEPPSNQTGDGRTSLNDKYGY